MEWNDIIRLMNKMDFDETSEKQSFIHEIRNLYEDGKLKKLLGNGSLESLKKIYFSVGASKTALDVSLSSLFGNTGNKEDLLLGHFNGILKDGLQLPTKKGALNTWLFLGGRGMDGISAGQLLKSKALENYPVDYLQKIKYFYFKNLDVFIELWDNYAQDFNDDEKKFIADLLHLLYPTSLSETSAEYVFLFIKKILPFFINRFFHRMDEKELLNNVDRIAEWFMVWERYKERKEQALENNDEYYSMEFSNVVKYVPEFIWWKNGIYYGKGNKNFYFGSPGFFHLAKGGSIRNAPDLHHYTRRMAKTFVNLPYDFDQEGKDMYIYFYGKSLGAGDLLSNMLQQFVRHPEDHIALQIELDKWNPVIQKFSNDEFEAIPEVNAVPFMGYIYHCLRDKPGFTVQRRSLRSLMEESDTYNARILERRQRREAEDQARRRRISWEEKRRKGIWDPHKKIKPFDEDPYRIEELTSKGMLRVEGMVMNHCVGSYADSCVKGFCSIWSLREYQDGKWLSRVTIELNKGSRIVQASARFNARPNDEHKKIIKRWAYYNKIATGIL